MRAVLTTFSLSRFALTSLNRFALAVAPLLRSHAPRAASEPAARRMDAATYAALLAEAERIAAPFRSHVDAQLADLRIAEQPAPEDFSDVEALLNRAGLLSD